MLYLFRLNAVLPNAEYMSKGDLDDKEDELYTEFRTLCMEFCQRNGLEYKSSEILDQEPRHGFRREV